MIFIRRILFGLGSNSMYNLLGLFLLKFETQRERNRKRKNPLQTQKKKTRGKYVIAGKEAL